MSYIGKRVVRKKQVENFFRHDKKIFSNINELSITNYDIYVRSD
jgi:hypothetical protein